MILLFTPAVPILFDNHTTTESQYLYRLWALRETIHLDF